MVICFYPNKNDHDGHWGIWDLEYLNYFSNQLNTKKEPFFSSVFTLSSHDPYKIPKKFKGKFKEGELPIHKTVRYTDYALKEFFASAKKQKWFDNTIFIITADHTSYSKEEYFYSPTGKYEIPLLFYSPKLIKPGFNDSSTVSHCDIFPSIMSLCNIKDSIFSLGRNVFEPQKGYSLNYDNGLLQIIQYPYCLRMSQNGKTKMHLQTKEMKNNGDIITQFDDTDATQKELSERLKAKHQYYLYSLLNNRYFIK
jgi:phosphoglycerol transferase MdoB-like AlkP superfamily enzyme